MQRYISSTTRTYAPTFLRSRASSDSRGAAAAMIGETPTGGSSAHPPPAAGVSAGASAVAPAWGGGDEGLAEREAARPPGIGRMMVRSSSSGSAKGLSLI